MDNPKLYRQSSDFASSGNDTSSIISLTVPAHSITTGSETVYSTTVSVPSNFFGKQLRAQITTSISGSKNVPYTYAVCIVPLTSPGGASSYSFIDVSRISGDSIRLQVRLINSIFPTATISIPSFDVTARVRTVVAD